VYVICVCIIGKETREVVDGPFLEVLKARLDGALSNLV